MHKIITNKERWDCISHILKSRNLYDVYFSYDYSKLYSENENGVPYLYIYEKNGEIFSFPLIVKPLPNYLRMSGFYDFETPYGYGGPISSTTDPNFIQEAWKGFIEWAKKSNIISGFIRLHPILCNHIYLKNVIDIKYMRDTVYVDLSKGIGHIWKKYPSRNRNCIRKAQKNNVIVKVYERDIDKYLLFMDIYNKRMQEIGANDIYLYKKYYFEKIANISDEIYLFLAYHEEHVVGGSIFFSTDRLSHYHLSAVLRKNMKLCVSNIIIHNAIDFFSKKRKEILHLGGGTSNAANDPLLFFKSGFSEYRLKYYTSSIIINNEIYQKACDIWKRSTNFPKILDKEIHLKYRLL